MNPVGAAEIRRLLDVVATRIIESRDLLTDLDRAIGDGDHGVNMAKGFNLCAQALGTPTPGLKESFGILGNTLMAGIGGSMGPLYGSFFLEMSAALAGKDTLDAQRFGEALSAGVTGVETVGSAKVGDKTLLDTLVPARDAYQAALAAGADFSTAISAMIDAAEQGWKSTKDLQARIGRAARLGERSIGVLDAGATSCFLIIRTIGSAIQKRLA